MFFKVIRFLLGNIILFIDFVTRPHPQKRNKAQQADVIKSASNLSLYQFNSCPFCVKTRRAMRRLNLPITTLDAKQPEHRNDLLNQGGSGKVPCLRIEESGKVRWMYESNDIISYLEQRFA